MCIIALKTAGNHLSEEEIRYDFRTNPNGAGFMYAKDEMVHWEKGFFSADELIKRWNAVVTDDMIAAIHTRISTHGERYSISLCHPFPLDGSDVYNPIGTADLVIMHNGIIPDRAWISDFQYGDSDTSALARKLSRYHNKGLSIDELADATASLDDVSRFLIMRGDGEVRMIGNWFEEAGIYFSNRNYRGSGRFSRFRFKSPAIMDQVAQEYDEAEEAEILMEADWEGLKEISSDSGVFLGIDGDNDLYFTDYTCNPDGSYSVLSWNIETKSFRYVKDAGFIFNEEQRFQKYLCL